MSMSFHHLFIIFHELCSFFEPKRSPMVPWVNPCESHSVSSVPNFRQAGECSSDTRLGEIGEARNGP